MNVDRFNEQMRLVADRVESGELLVTWGVWREWVARNSKQKYFLTACYCPVATVATDIFGAVKVNPVIQFQFVDGKGVFERMAELLDVPVETITTFTHRYDCLMGQAPKLDPAHTSIAIRKALS